MIHKIALKIRPSQQLVLIDFVAYTALILLAYFVFAPSINPQYFIFDDLHHDARANELADLSWWKLFFSGVTGIPVFFGIYNLLARFYEGEIFVVTLKSLNLILHYLNAVLIYQISTRLIGKVRSAKNYSPNALRFSSLFLASLFVVHPLQVESLVWISSLKGTLALFFVLAALWLNLVERRKHFIHRLLIHFLILVFFALSLWSKPSLIALPFIFALLDWRLFNRTLKASLLSHSYLLIAAIPLGYFHIWTFTPWILSLFLDRVINPFPSLSWGWLIPPSALLVLSCLTVWIYKKFNNKKDFYRYGFIALCLILTLTYLPYFSLFLSKTNGSIVVFVYTFFKILYPVNLGFDYGVNLDFISLHYGIVKQVISVLIFGGLIIYFRSKKTTLSIVILYLIALPYLGFFMYEFGYISFFADRFAYPILAALCIILTYPVCKVLSRFPFAISALFFALCTFSIQKSINQINLWASSESFLQHSLIVNPTSVATRLALASLYELNEAPEISVLYYNEALAISTHNSETYISLLYLLLRMQRYQDVLDTVQKISILTPVVDKEVFPILARTYASLGDVERAEFFSRISLMHIPWDYFSIQLLDVIEQMKNIMKDNHEE
jgi:tetratricopeptide (TPR) repeat protein